MVITFSGVGGGILGVYTIPIKYGGIFIDTDKEFPTISGNSVTCPNDTYFVVNLSGTQYTLNGKAVMYKHSPYDLGAANISNSSTNGYISPRGQCIIGPGDTITGQILSAYPLLMDGSGSGGNVSSSSSTYCNCGNPIFFDSQESDNYVWEPVYEANSTEFTKIATHDCVAIPLMIDRNFYTTNNVADADHTIPYWRLYEEVRIDDLLINPVTLALANNNAGVTGFYLKKG